MDCAAATALPFRYWLTNVTQTATAKNISAEISRLYRNAELALRVAITISPAIAASMTPCHKECINVLHKAPTNWSERLFGIMAFQFVEYVFNGRDVGCGGLFVAEQLHDQFAGRTLVDGINKLIQQLALGLL